MTVLFGQIPLIAFAMLMAAGPALVASPEESHADSRIAFIQSNASTPGGDVYTMNPDGSDVRQLTNLGAHRSASWENWSADGKQLVFSEYPENAPGQLWLMQADGSNQHLLLREADHGENAASFSPDGGWVIFTRCQTVQQGDGCAIYRIRTDGSGLTPVVDFEPEVNNWEPVYSPDGMKVAFESFSRDGFISRIWVMNADASDLHPITPPELTAVNPQWSRDGEKIAFRSHCCNPQNSDVFVIDRDGGGLMRLTGNRSSDQDIPVAYVNVGPSWSPHGHAIVFNQFKPDNSSTIFTISAEGRDEGEESRMTRLMNLPAMRRLPEGLASADRAGADKRSHRRRRRTPHEIEENGFLPRWSPELQ